MDYQIDLKLNLYNASMHLQMCILSGQEDSIVIINFIADLRGVWPCRCEIACEHFSSYVAYWIALKYF